MLSIQLRAVGIQVVSVDNVKSLYDVRIHAVYEDIRWSMSNPPKRPRLDSLYLLKLVNGGN